MSAMRDAIVLTLQADAGLIALVDNRIYANQPPEGSQYPLVMVSAQTPPTPERVFQQVGFERAVYLVRGCSISTSPAEVDDINAAIRTALDGATLTITGKTERGIYWQGDYETHEVYDGQTYQYAGGLYEVMAE